MWHATCRVCPGRQYVPLVGLLVLGMLLVIIIPRGELMAQPQAAVRAPECPDGMPWLNTESLRGLAAPMAVAGFSDTNFGDEEVMRVAPQQVKAGAAGKILINLQFSEGYHLNPRAPLNYSVSVSGEGIHIADSDRMGQAIAPSLPLAIPFQAAAGSHQATADIAMTFYYCRTDDTGVCVMQSVRWQVPLHTDPAGSASAAVVSYKAEAPVVQKQL